MPPITIPTPPLVTIADPFDNADAVAEAAISPAVTLRPLCLFCGDDYVITPDTTSTDDPTTMLIDGCECPGCEALRALAVPTADDTPVVIDPTPYMSPLSGTAYSERIAAPTHFDGVLCPSCAGTLRSQWVARRCNYCSEMLAPSALTVPIAGRDATSDALRRITPDAVLSSMTLGLAPLRSTSRTRLGAGSWYFREPVLSDELNADGIEELVCHDCLENAVSCHDCDSLCASGAHYTCDDCDVDSCHACYRAYHTHRESNTLETARGSFRPRTSVGRALEAVGYPGDTILSTRAIGIEVETSRGDAMAVVACEMDAPVPVIAQLGSDGSVRGRGAVEFRLLPQRGMWAEYALRSMAEWCDAAGYRPDSTAGIHMHVDCTGLINAEVYQALAVLLSLEDVLFAHAARERRLSTYCLPFEPVARTTAIQAALAAARSGRNFTYTITGDSRYRSVNTHAYSSHGTLEVRVFDSAHTPEASARFIDAAAIIAGAVDFARTAEFLALVEANPTLPDADVVLARMAETGHITSACALRAIARLREATPRVMAA